MSLLDIDALNIRAVYSKSMIGDILTDMKRVGDLAINSEMWKELVEDSFMRGKKKIEPKVMFATVPRCLVSSLRFVEMKGSISGYEGEMELIRYFLKNSTILEKLKLHLYYTTAKEKFAFLTELVAMPRCCSACELICQSSRLKPLPKFGYMSRLHINLRLSGLNRLQNFLKSFPNLKSLILVMIYSTHGMVILKSHQINFSSVPDCLLSSLEFVDFEVAIWGLAGEMKLARYFLEKSAILKKTHSPFES
ncbi:unnamed protein product [Thlaspi arvense]|uniref:FBD domain-containing protein n=1 Tax=Thlaspi arvense TaxID=13288 RepID=A0AAU9SKU9_THLAR|nr:unnamed protein product [Thlaspi arvense]